MPGNVKRPTGPLSAVRRSKTKTNFKLIPASSSPRSNASSRRGSVSSNRGGDATNGTATPRDSAHGGCDCPVPKYENIDGTVICRECGTQISESNIVAEVTFGETSTGAATVQGGFVGEGARHAKTLGAAATRRIGGGGGDEGSGRFASREETEANGRAELRQLCPQLRIPGNVEDVAFNLWKLAASHNFIQGRRTGEVAGVCLYAACRRERHNTILLMDISEALSVNVFKLGDTYKELSRELYLEVHSHLQPVVEVEPLLMRYCSKLEFGTMTRQVAEDAARIVKRMKRDWMVTGRHPAGLCGACIILAARMNNFRRTVREVVYVVRVSDLTIVARLAEFKRTRSSAMSVEQFREKGLKLKFAHDPPSVTAAEDRKKKMEATIQRRAARASARNSVEEPTTEADQSTEAATAAETNPTPPSTDPSNTVENSTAPTAEANPLLDPALQEQSQQVDQSSLDILANAAAADSQPTPPATQQTADAPAATQEVRRDADGFVIPALPSSQSNGQADGPRKRGRPKASEQPVIQLTPDDFAEEEALEHDIENVLQDPECVSARNETEREKLDARASVLAEQQRAEAAAASAARLAARGRGTSSVSDNEIIGEDEFADDPEVVNALLDEEAVRVKETIWLRDNEDWLRAQQVKHLKQMMEEAEGKSDPSGKGGKKKKRKRSRMGDGTVLTEKGTPVESPADAAQRMLEKRAGKGFSRAVDYAALNRIFGGDVGPGKAEKERAAREEGRSRSASVSSMASSATVYTFIEEDIENLDPRPPKKRKKSTSAESTKSAASKGAANAASPSVADAAATEKRRGSRDEPVEIEDNGKEEPEVEEEEEDDDDDDAMAGDEEEPWAPPSPEAYDDDDGYDFERAQRDVTGDFGSPMA